MKITKETLPNEAEKLKKIILDLSEEKNTVRLPR